MVYTAQTWVDGPSGSTPITAARLTHIEQGIAGVVQTVNGVAPALGGDISVPSDSLKSLCLFYAPPTTVNTVYDLDYAAGLFSNFGHVVFGAGLDDPTNTYHADTQTIIGKMAVLSPKTTVWGYIDSGVTTANYPLATIYTKVDNWVAMGAKGIFLDVFGYDFHTSRSRQNSILDYIHSKGVGAIINAYNADDAFSSVVNATYNPTGTPTHATSQDALLLESWVFNSTAYASPYFATFSDIKTRADKARTYRDSLGIRIFSVSMLTLTGTNEGTLNFYRGMAESLSRIFRLDACGVSPATYSSSGVDASAAEHRAFQLQATPSRPDALYHLNGPWTEVSAPDLDLTVHFEPASYTWTAPNALPLGHAGTHAASGTDVITPAAIGAVVSNPKNGLIPIALAGRSTTPGAPTTGTWAANDLMIDSNGAWHLCKTAGTPGTWS